MSTPDTHALSDIDSTVAVICHARTKAHNDDEREGGQVKIGGEMTRSRGDGRKWSRKNQRDDENCRNWSEQKKL